MLNLGWMTDDKIISGIVIRISVSCCICVFNFNLGRILIYCDRYYIFRNGVRYWNGFLIFADWMW